jgi:hypothetical protein
MYIRPVVKQESWRKNGWWPWREAGSRARGLVRMFARRFGEPSAVEALLNGHRAGL